MPTDAELDREQDPHKAAVWIMSRLVRDAMLNHSDQLSAAAAHRALRGDFARIPRPVRAAIRWLHWHSALHSTPTPMHAWVSEYVLPVFAKSRDRFSVVPMPGQEERWIIIDRPADGNVAGFSYPTEQAAWDAVAKL